MAIFKGVIVLVDKSQILVAAVREVREKKVANVQDIQYTQQERYRISHFSL